MKNTIDTTKSPFLTPAELAARWQVTPMTLRRWRKSGRLASFQLGRGVRFNLADVERLEKEARA